MTEPDTDNTIILAGRVVRFTPPTQGQIESMVRIARTLREGPEDAPTEFWVTQVSRIGLLIDSLIAEGDRETVDTLYLTGKISAADALKAIIEKTNANAKNSEQQTVVKANKTRVRRD